MGIVIRKITFWAAVAAAAAVFIAIFVLTEQSPGDTTALSASVSDAIVSRQVDAVGAGETDASSGASAAGEGAVGPIEAMLAIGNVRKWAHTAEFCVRRPRRPGVRAVVGEAPRGACARPGCGRHLCSSFPVRPDAQALRPRQGVRRRGPAVRPARLLHGDRARIACQHGSQAHPLRREACSLTGRFASSVQVDSPFPYRCVRRFRITCHRCW